MIKSISSMRARAFSTIELSIALALFSMCFASFAFASYGLPITLEDGYLHYQAALSADSDMQRALISGSKDFASVTAVATSTIAGIARSQSVGVQDDGITKYVTETVSWVDARGTRRYVIRTASLADLSRVSDTDWCGSLSQGTWTEPSVRSEGIGSGPDQLLPSGMPTFAIGSLAAASTTLLMAATTTAHKADDDLLLFDISSTTDPRFLSGIDTATSTRTGISSAVIAGKIAYVASAIGSTFSTCKKSPSCAQMQVISLSDRSSPSIRSNFQLATATPPYAVGTGGQSIEKSIAYENGYVYLGLSKTGTSTGEEFNVLDASDPSKPVWVGGFRIGRSINSIIVKGAYAYIATDGPQQELVVLDVRDPAHIQMVASYDAPGNGLYGYGKDVYASSSTIVLGRSYAPGSSELLVLTRTGASITLTGSAFAASSSDPVSISSLLVEGARIAVLTDRDLEFWDTTSGAPMRYGTLVPESQGSAFTSLACINGTLYAGSFDSSSSPRLITLTSS